MREKSQVTKTRSDQVQVGDVVDFDQHRYWTCDRSQDSAGPMVKMEGCHTVASAEVGTYKTTSSSFRRSPGSRGVKFTYESGSVTFHNFSEKLPVLSRGRRCPLLD